MRLFVALDIDAEIRQRISRFVEGVRNFAPHVRWVSAASFHITLKFIGERSPEDMEAIKQALERIEAPPTTVTFRNTGFFPTARSARVFWIGIEADANLASLAAQVDEQLSVLGIPSEDRPFTPHLTLARGGDSRHPRGGSGRPGFKAGDRPNARFGQLAEKLEKLPAPEFGTMTAQEFFLYQSKLSPRGAEYTKLASFSLTGGC